METNVTVPVLYPNIKETTTTATPVYVIEINWLDNWWSFTLTTLASIPYCYIFAKIYRQKYTRRLNFRMGNMAVAGFVIGWLTCLKFSEGKTAFAGPNTCPAFGYITDVCWSVIGLSVFALNHERMRELNMFWTKMPPCSWETACFWGILEYIATDFVEKDGDCVFTLLGKFTKSFHLFFESTKTLIFTGYISIYLLRRMIKPRRPKCGQFEAKWLLKRDNIKLCCQKLTQILGIPMDSEKRARYNIALNSWRFFCFIFVAMWTPIGILNLMEKWALKYDIVQDYIIDYDLLTLNWALKRLFLFFIPLGLVFVDNRFRTFIKYNKEIEVSFLQPQSPTPILKTIGRQMEQPSPRIEIPGSHLPILSQPICTCLEEIEKDEAAISFEIKERTHRPSVQIRRSKSCPIIDIWDAETQTEF